MKHIELVKDETGNFAQPKLPWRDPFMTDEDREVARQNKNRLIPTYPDIRELTDESKKLLRKKKVTKVTSG